MAIKCCMCGNVLPVRGLSVILTTKPSKTRLATANRSHVNSQHSSKSNDLSIRKRCPYYLARRAYWGAQLIFKGREPVRRWGYHCCLSCCMSSATPNLRLPSLPHITVLTLVPYYTAWLQRHV